MDWAIVLTDSEGAETGGMWGWGGEQRSYLGQTKPSARVGNLDWTK